MSQNNSRSTLTGSRIKEIRQKNGLSQQEFGARLGVSHAHISKIESGKENPSETLLKLIGYEFCTEKIDGIPTSEETKPKIQKYLAMIEDLIVNSDMSDGILYNTEFIMAALITIYQDSVSSEKYHELLLECLGGILDEVSIFLSRTNNNSKNASMRALDASKLQRAKNEIIVCCKGLCEILEERVQ